jgi:hypothetical protein
MAGSSPPRLHDAVRTTRAVFQRRRGAWPSDLQAASAIESRHVASLADKDTWRTRFPKKREAIRRIAQEAIAEDDRGETLPLDDLF